MSGVGPADLSGLRIDRDAPPRGGGAPRWLVALLVAIALLIAAGFWLAPRLFPRTTDVAVAVAEPLGGALGAGGSEVLTASGYVVARQRAAVSTETSGRLAALYVEEGSRVARGQILGVLRNDEQKAAVESAKAALASARADLTEARASAHESDLARSRSRELLSRALISQAEFDQADARAKVDAARVGSAEANLENAAARLRAAEVDLERTFIRAPFAGAVLRKEAEVGEIVSPLPSSGGLTRGAVVTMANLATLEVEVDVNEGYVARTRDGMRAEIALDAYPDVRYPGRVRQIVPTADRQKATVQVKVAFDSLDARVLPEMGCKVTFLADAPAAGGDTASAAIAAVTVPNGAIADRDGRAVVFVMERGRAALRDVSPRPYGADRAAVSGGIAAGERVVVSAPPTLRDGDRIRAK